MNLRPVKVESRMEFIFKAALMKAALMFFGLSLGLSTPVHSFESAPLPSPPDFVKTSSSLNFENDGAQGASELEKLTPGTRKLAAILLKGAFESDSKKVSAINEAYRYFDALSAGEKLDLLLGLLNDTQNAQKAGKDVDFIKNDSEVAAQFRLKMLAIFLNTIERSSGAEDAAAIKAVLGFLGDLSRTQSATGNPSSIEIAQKLQAYLRQDSGKNLDLISRAITIFSTQNSLSSLPIGDASKIQMVNELEPLYQKGISEIENVADVVANSDQLKNMPQDAQRLLQIFLGNYYRLTKLQYKKDMLMGILELPGGAGVLDKLGVLFRKSGPVLQKFLQLLAQRKDVGDEVRIVAKTLEDDADSVGFEEADQALRERIPDLYPAKTGKPGIVRISRKPFAGSMAQTYKAEYRRSDGSIVPVAIRMIKPGIHEKIDNDEHIISMTIPQIEKDPVLQGTPLSKIGSVVPDLLNQVRIEADARIGTKNQQRGLEVYEGEISINNKPFKIRLQVKVPKILHPDTAEKGVQIMEWVEGTKIEKFFENFPESYRAVTEAAAAYWIEKSIFGSGYYHMDMHPGNLLAKRMPDGSISITLLDFGMEGKILSPELRAAMIRLPSEVLSKNRLKASASLNFLLNEPLPAPVMNQILDEAFKVENPTVFYLTEQLLIHNGKLKRPLVDFNRGMTFVTEMLAKSGNPKDIDTLLTEVGSKRILSAAAGIIQHGSARTEDGVPLTRGELVSLAKTMFSTCIKSSFNGMIQIAKANQGERTPSGKPAGTAAPLSGWSKWVNRFREFCKNLELRFQALLK